MSSRPSIKSYARDDDEEVEVETINLQGESNLVILFEEIYASYPQLSVGADAILNDNKELVQAYRFLTPHFETLYSFGPVFNQKNKRQIAMIYDLLANVADEEVENEIALMRELFQRPESILWTLSNPGVFAEDIELLSSVLDRLEFSDKHETIATEFLSLVITYQDRSKAIEVMNATMNSGDHFLWSLPTMAKYEERYMVNINKEMATMEGAEIPGRSCKSCDNKTFFISQADKGRGDDARSRSAICARCNAPLGVF